GLGLAICRQLVQLHGGTIQAQSEGVGKGATFTVLLPLPRTTSHGTKAVKRRRHTADTSKARKHPASEPALRGVRVLVVEDDPNTREAIARTVASAGAEPVAVDSASAALDRIT